MERLAGTGSSLITGSLRSWSDTEGTHPGAVSQWQSGRPLLSGRLTLHKNEPQNQLQVAAHPPGWSIKFELRGDGFASRRSLLSLSSYLTTQKPDVGDLSG